MVSIPRSMSIRSNYHELNLTAGYRASEPQCCWLSFYALQLDRIRISLSTHGCNCRACASITYWCRSSHCRSIRCPLSRDFRASRERPNGTISQVHKANCGASCGSNAVRCRTKSTLGRQFIPLAITTHRNWINSPSSAGKLLSLLLERSKVLRLTRRPISEGKRERQLSFR